MYWEYHPGREPQADEGYMYQTTCAVVVVVVVFVVVVFVVDVIARNVRKVLPVILGSVAKSSMVRMTGRRWLS